MCIQGRAVGLGWARGATAPLLLLKFHQNCIKIEAFASNFCLLPPHFGSCPPLRQVPTPLQGVLLWHWRYELAVWENRGSQRNSDRYSALKMPIFHLSKKCHGGKLVVTSTRIIAYLVRSLVSTDWSSLREGEGYTPLCRLYVRLGCTLGPFCSVIGLLLQVWD